MTHKGFPQAIGKFAVFPQMELLPEWVATQDDCRLLPSPGVGSYMVTPQLEFGLSLLLLDSFTVCSRSAQGSYHALLTRDSRQI